jgi:septal ring factor EnvC (AmiA/AmiB activator)
MSFLKKSESLITAIAALDAKISEASAQILAMGVDITKLANSDEAGAKSLIKQRSKLAEQLDFDRFKRAGLNDELVDMKADLIREKITDLNMKMCDKQHEMEQALAQKLKLEASLRETIATHQTLLGNVSNLGAQIGDLEQELSKLTKSNSLREEAV